MKLEDQVVSLELAKKLKELGVKQESWFVWAQNRQTALPEPTLMYRPDFIAWNSDPITGAYAFQYEEMCSAFTVAEMGEMLQNASTNEDYVQLPVWHKKLKGFASPSIWLGKAVDEKTEADARAKMLIYLIENNLITL